LARLLVVPSLSEQIRIGFLRLTKLEILHIIDI